MLPTSAVRPPSAASVACRPDLPLAFRLPLGRSRPPCSSLRPSAVHIAGRDPRGNVGGIAPRSATMSRAVRTAVRLRPSEHPFGRSLPREHGRSIGTRISPQQVISNWRTQDARRLQKLSPVGWSSGSSRSGLAPYVAVALGGDVSSTAIDDANRLRCRHRQNTIDQKHRKWGYRPLYLNRCRRH